MNPLHAELLCLDFLKLKCGHLRPLCDWLPAARTSRCGAAAAAAAAVAAAGGALSGGCGGSAALLCGGAAAAAVAAASGDALASAVAAFRALAF